MLKPLLMEHKDQFSFRVNPKVADDLVTQGARISAVMELTYYPRILGLHHYEA